MNRKNLRDVIKNIISEESKTLSKEELDADPTNLNKDLSGKVDLLARMQVDIVKVLQAACTSLYGGFFIFIKMFY